MNKKIPDKPIWEILIERPIWEWAIAGIGFGIASKLYDDIKKSITRKPDKPDSISEGSSLSSQSVVPEFSSPPVSYREKIQQEPDNVDSQLSR